MKIIFAQGNPGLKYETTRHNIGALLLGLYAKERQATWKDQAKFQALIAEVPTATEKTLLVFPQTYYNDTGICARRLIDFYKIDPQQDLLVLHDDLALPFGTLRTRAKGSDAGNNGIKSLNSHLGEAYHRLRIGIQTERPAGLRDVDYVLGRFRDEELTTIKKTLAPTVFTIIDDFIAGSMALTSQTSEH